MDGMHERLRNTFLTLVAIASCSSCSYLGLGGGTSAPDVVGEEVRYTAADGTTCVGYLAYDRNREGSRPGVLVVHEWWGHNDYARRRAEMLAGMGYTALALDMYGEGKNTGHPEEASAFSSAVMQNMGAGVQRFEAARKVLEEHPTTNPEKTAAIGYCFGGAVVLGMARSGMDLDGVASFHGMLATEQRTTPDALHAQVLVCHGGADQFVPAEDVTALKQEMGDKLELHEYPGAKHAFTNPAADAKAEEFGIPLGYDAQADAQSWSELRAFLADVFAD